MDNNKINKYLYRIKKTLGKNNLLKTKKYLFHLKYHIQKGGLLLNDTINKLDEIINIINVSDNNFNIDKMKKSIDDLKTQLQQQTLQGSNNSTTKEIIPKIKELLLAIYNDDEKVTELLDNL